VSFVDGVERLWHWIDANVELFGDPAARQAV
jgi:hypothetical protein